jgi:ribose transport system ATP-binding protein
MDDWRTIIRLTGVSKHFPGVKALEDITLDIKEGEILGLVGENGAGKSTLVKILAGVYKKDAGEIFINGEKCVVSSPIDAQERGLSFIFQERNLSPFLSIQENIFAGRQPVSRFGFINWKALSERTLNLLNLLKLDLAPSTLVNRLSVAQQQIVEIGRALSFNSRVIVMDEPTASISDEETGTLFEIMRQLKNGGVTVIFISHRLVEVMSVTDRIVILRDGLIVGIKETAKTNIDELIKLMVGRDIKEAEKQELIPPKEKLVLSVRELNCPGVFKNISFDLHEGEILGFAGLVGARRTELLRALYGFQGNVSGDIFINDQKVLCSTPVEAMEHGIGYLSEDRKKEGIFPFMSVYKNITIASLKVFTRFGYMNQKLEREKSQELVKALDIKTPSLTTLLFSLSGGNQQKTIIARDLLIKPKIFLLDEPTAGIDVGAKFEIYNILRKLASDGVSIIFVSSELPELLRLCHRIIVMCQGRITGAFTAEDADQEKIMFCATKFE